MGTAGQRCTTLRRLFVHESVYDQLVPQLIKVYGNVQVGDPRTEGTLVGPLIDRMAFDGMQRRWNKAVRWAPRCTAAPASKAWAARCLLRAPRAGGAAKARRPRAARNLCAHPVRHPLQHAGRSHCHEQRRGAGLSSSIFTLNMREAEQFMSGLLARTAALPT